MILQYGQLHFSLPPMLAGLAFAIPAIADKIFY